MVQISIVTAESVSKLEKSIKERLHELEKDNSLFSFQYATPVIFPNGSVMFSVMITASPEKIY